MLILSCKTNSCFRLVAIEATTRRISGSTAASTLSKSSHTEEVHLADVHHGQLQALPTHETGHGREQEQQKYSPAYRECRGHRHYRHDDHEPTDRSCTLVYVDFNGLKLLSQRITAGAGPHRHVVQHNHVIIILHETATFECRVA